MFVIFHSLVYSVLLLVMIRDIWLTWQTSVKHFFNYFFFFVIMFCVILMFFTLLPINRRWWPVPSTKIVTYVVVNYLKDWLLATCWNINLKGQILRLLQRVQRLLLDLSIDTQTNIVVNGWPHMIGSIYNFYRNNLIDIWICHNLN